MEEISRIATKALLIVAVMFTSVAQYVRFEKLAVYLVGPGYDHWILVAWFILVIAMLTAIVKLRL